MLLFFDLSARSQYFLTTSFLDSAEKKTTQKYGFNRKEFNSEKERKASLSKLLFKLRQDGFLTASIDSLITDSNSISAHIYLGNKYKWAKLGMGNVDEEVLNNIGAPGKLFHRKNVSPFALATLMERIISFEENNGYPFAVIALDSIKLFSAEISAVLKLEKNNLCIIDSFLVRGNSKLPS